MSRARALPIAVFLVLATTSPLVAQERVPLPRTSFGYGDLLLLNGLDGPVRAALRSPAEWKQFWADQMLPMMVEPPPGVDFTKQIVLLAAADVAEPVSTQIGQVWDEGDTLTVDVVLSVTCGGEVMLPLDAVVVEHDSVPVRFITRREHRSCR
jgi:hypothetical protein